jgi:hypothetical protein
MRDKHLDLNTSPDLPQSSASYEGGTNGAVAGTNRQALKRGYATCEHPEGNEYATPREAQGGFVGRAHGWER